MGLARVLGAWHPVLGGTTMMAPHPDCAAGGGVHSSSSSSERTYISPQPNDVTEDTNHQIAFCSKGLASGTGFNMSTNYLDIMCQLSVLHKQGNKWHNKETMLVICSEEGVQCFRQSPKVGFLWSLRI